MHSRCRIELVRSTVAALRAHQTLQKWERRVAGEARAECHLVFCTLTSGPFGSGSTSHVKDRALESANLPRVRTHDLRHTAATDLLSGVNTKVVQGLLGHSSIALTMNTLAAIDRVVHHTVILDLMTADSYRAKEAGTSE